MKANVGDILRDPKDGEEFRIDEIYPEGVNVTCVRLGSVAHREIGQFFRGTSKVEGWLKNGWEVIPGKENRIKKLLSKIDEQQDH